MDIEKNKTIKNRRGLALKLLAAIIVIVAVVSVASIWVGRSIYWDDITKHYDTMAKQVAKSVEGVFTQQEFEEWGDLACRSVHGEDVSTQIEEITSSERYQEVKRLTENLCRSIEANDIYVVYYDTSVLDDYTPEGFEEGTWTPFCYLMDTYVVPEEQFPMGSGSVCDPDFRYQMKEYYEKGEDPEETIITYFTDKYILTGLHTVSYGNGGVAIVGVEMPIPTLESDMGEFVKKIVLIDLIVAAVLIILFTILMTFLIARPIRKVSGEAARFVDDNANVSEILGRIKTHDEIQTLSESLLSLEHGIRDYIENLTTVTAEKERYQTELNVAARMQADTLTSDFDIRKELTLYATMTPAREMGGDFYDYFAIDDDHVGIVMADVSGKGIPAAMFMIVAKTLLKVRSTAGGTPAQMMYDVNNTLCMDNPFELFVTVWFAILTVSTGELVCSNAGHEYPVVLRDGNRYELLMTDNMPPLAAMEDLEFVDESIMLKPGDRIFLYTDGVPEAKNADGKRFGIDRMMDVLDRNKTTSPSTLLSDMEKEIRNFTGEMDPFDDITMMSIIWNGNANA